MEALREAETRRSYSYDDSFLQHHPEEPRRQPGQTQYLYQQKSTIDSPLQSTYAYGSGSPTHGSWDDSAIGTTRVVSPLARLREAAMGISTNAPSMVPTVSPDYDNDSVPFDQQQDDEVNEQMYPKSRANHRLGSPMDRSVGPRPFDEDSNYNPPPSPHAPVSPTDRAGPLVIQSRVHGPHRSATDIHKPDTRFRMPPLRVSKPALDAGLADEEGYEEGPSSPSLGGYYPQPPSLYRITQQTHGSSPLHAAHTSPGRARVRGTDGPNSPKPDAYEEFGDGSINTRGNTTEEDDSLFDFQSKRRGQQKRRNHPLVSGDETSEEGASDTPKSLTQRAHEAWKRKSARERHKANADPHVSFSEKNPSVHRYNEYATENSTLAGASLNSEYTKSMESEVEDAIKDIFLIGSGTGNHPGRRKLKHRPDMRRRLRQERQHDDDTLESEDETPDNQVVLEDVPASKNDKNGRSRARSSTRDKSHRDEKKEEEPDPLLGAWTMVESGLQAVGVALGIETQDDETILTNEDSQQEDGSELFKKQQESGKISRKKSSTEKTYDSSEGPSKVSSSKQEKAAPAESTNMLNLFSVGMLGSSNKAPEETVSPKNSSAKLTAQETKMSVSRSYLSNNVGGASKGDDDGDDKEKSLPSLDKDLRLIELAIQSARSYHKMKGIAYDESDVDIVTDIKFIVVDLTLPLGLIFQENESGCWVTKVLTEGSAIKKSIQVGDQLAAIDGKSAIRLTVEDIALAIRKKKDRPFELTFLRYVGPLRPAEGAFQEQGYEVKARVDEDRKKSRKSRRHQKHKEKDKTDDEKKESLSELEDSPTRDKRRFRIFGRKK